PRSADYNKAPVVIFWETTKACALACKHCRATAQPQRHPDELTTEEGFRLIEEIARFPGKPILILTGGDALMRRDLFDLMQHAKDTGVLFSLSPTASALVTRERLTRAKEMGLSRLSFSLDGATPEIHDSFRGFGGSYQRTMESIREAVDVGLSLQVNTTVSRRNLADLPAIAEMVRGMGVVLWDLFFLVPVGRGSREDVITPRQHEELYNWLYDLGNEAPYAIKVTLGQPYRRVALHRQGHDAPPKEGAASVPTTNDGKGACFISHVGEVYPSGFLPILAGNVRQRSLVDIYQNAPIFKELRDSSLLKGKCGVCSFNEVCGGCRARAYGFTGDYLAPEPCCVYQPPGSAEDARQAA
ncbi:MAG: TIGR04053 family radical SAM/SPASM domain-containing protein, partial [Chloroflexota bacterium]|nr:TIGR04053 family radical SAM/SPASM domain-containing protein [Chloroflexota bacterium]